jgi:tetratricopeptide (TPR) repeat protein
MVLEQLEKILQSSVFSLSVRLSRFLRFVVETALRDRSCSLKEYVIGTEVYDRKPPYHPSLDSIVRTEAHRLKAKLKEYYDTEGRADPIYIYFRSGSYAPVFRFQTLADGDENALEIEEGNEEPGSFELSITLMAYEDVSGDPLSRDCARIISEELKHQLIAGTEWRVIVPSPVLQAIDEYPSPLDNVRMRGGDLVLQGTVAKDKERLVITSRLSSADGTQICSYRFERIGQHEDLLNLSHEAASAVISRMPTRELRAQRSSLMKGKPLCHEAALVLAAEAQLEEGSAAAIQNAHTRFLELIQSSPVEARAYYGIAQCQLEIALSGAAGSRDAVCLAKKAVLRALLLTPHNPSADSCYGFILALEGNASAAEKAFEYAYTLGPQVCDYRRFALFLTAQGRFDDAWHVFQKAQAIDPFSFHQKLACARILYLSRRYEDLLQRFDGPLTYGPLPAQVDVFRGLAYLELGRFAEARETAHRIRQESLFTPQLMAPAAEIFAHCGDIALAQGLAAQFKLLSPGSALSKMGQASLARALGDRKSSLKLLASAIALGEAELLWINVDPRFDDLRGDGNWPRSDGRSTRS